MFGKYTQKMKCKLKDKEHNRFVFAVGRCPNCKGTERKECKCGNSQNFGDSDLAWSNNHCGACHGKFTHLYKR